MNVRLLTRLVTLAALVGPLLSAPPAAAQDAQEVAATATLFKHSVAQMKAGQFAEACPGIEEVVRRTPDGIGAKLALAECYEGLGKLASALGVWTQAAGQARVAGQNDRAATAGEHAARLEPLVSHLVLRVPPEVAALPELVVKYGQVTAARAQWGLPLPVDGGTVTVTVTAAGKAPWTKQFQVAREKATVEVVVGMLENAAPTAPALAPPPPPPAFPPAAPSPSAPPPPAPPAPPPSGGVPVWAWVVGGVGLGMLGASAAFRVDQTAAGRTLDTDCPNGRVCPVGYDWAPVYAREKRSFGLFVGLGAGGLAAVGAGLAGIITGARRPAASADRTAWSVAPSVSPSGAGLTASRDW